MKLTHVGRLAFVLLLGGAACGDGAATSNGVPQQDDAAASNDGSSNPPTSDDAGRVDPTGGNDSAPSPDTSRTGSDAPEAGIAAGDASIAVSCAAIASTLSSSDCDSHGCGHEPGLTQTPAHVAAPCDPTKSHYCGLRVAGGHIVNKDNVVVQIHGVNIPHTEDACGWPGTGSTFAGTPGVAGTLNRLKAYNSNAVRIPLNEQCWLGVNGLPHLGGGWGEYQSAIVTWVNLITSTGMVPIVDLHRAAPGTTVADNGLPHGQGVLPDNDYSIDFWRSLALVFKGNDSVVFELFNEPNPISGPSDSNYAAAWKCLKLGGSNCTSKTINLFNPSVNGSLPAFHVAGMQDLVNAVRCEGATNVLLLGGPCDSWCLDLWSQFVPDDPLANTSQKIPPQLGAVWHRYAYDGAAICNGNVDAACLTQAVKDVTAVVASNYPVVMTETGSTPGARAADLVWLDGVLGWFDSHQQGYTAWSWVTDDAPHMLSSISADGATVTLNDFGTNYTAHIATLPNP